MKDNNKELNIKLEKDIKHSKLYIMDYKYDANTFESKLLDAEKIDKILYAKRNTEDGKNSFEFDINKFCSLDDYLKKNKLRFIDICNLIKQINECYAIIDNYLLNVSSLVLDSRFIFLDCKNHFKNINFIVLPNYDSDASYSLSKLLIRVLRNIDCDDKDALNLAYALFQASQTENYTIDDLLFVVNQNEEKVFPLDYDINKAIDEEYAKEALKEEKELPKFNIEDAYYEIENEPKETIIMEPKEATIIEQNDAKLSCDYDDIFNLDDEPKNEICDSDEKQLNIEKKKKTKLPTKKQFVLLAQKTALVALFGVAFPFCLVCVLVLR